MSMEGNVYKCISMYTAMRISDVIKAYEPFRNWVGRCEEYLC